eukprot:GHVP01024158.1.p1 GENE.GHVP01024158.1~~GHVP01024158.1.p1  ORF type:complete len:243 (-),score=40.44 GHVP01024158.1:73-759(-)
MHAITQFAEFAVPSLNNAWANDEDLLPSHNEAPQADITFRMFDKPTEDTDDSTSLRDEKVKTEADKKAEYKLLWNSIAPDDTNFEANFEAFEKTLEVVSNYLGGITIEKPELPKSLYTERFKYILQPEDSEQEFNGVRVRFYLTLPAEGSSETQGVICFYGCAQQGTIGPPPRASFYVDKRNGEICQFPSSESSKTLSPENRKLVEKILSQTTNDQDRLLLSKLLLLK